MKTLVVLSALASIAIAAPALPGEEFDPTQNNSPTILRREKKSLMMGQLQGAPAMAEGIDITPFVNSALNSGFDSSPMGRSHLGFKKPIIVKKKFGYHLYRDSDEEQAQADPQEKCMKQVKVKLCDEDSQMRTSDMRSAASEMSDIHVSEGDMEHSIKMAKEAVENLQRDLQKMTHTSDAKMAQQWKNTDQDMEMHENIEMARQALEHIQSNFGNLESMNLHATAVKNAETVHDINFKMAKTEEERMSQWKEAIENIQRNVDIVKNIEDSFKLTPGESEKSNMMRNVENENNQKETLKPGGDSSNDNTGQVNNIGNKETHKDVNKNENNEKVMVKPEDNKEENKEGHKESLKEDRKEDHKEDKKEDQKEENKVENKENSKEINKEVNKENKKEDTKDKNNENNKEGNKEINKDNNKESSDSERKKTNYERVENEMKRVFAPEQLNRTETSTKRPRASTSNPIGKRYEVVDETKDKNKEPQATIMFFVPYTEPNDTLNVMEDIHMAVNIDKKNAQEESGGQNMAMKATENLSDLKKTEENGVKLSVFDTIIDDLKTNHNIPIIKFDEKKIIHEHDHMNNMSKLSEHDKTSQARITSTMKAVNNDMQHHMPNMRWHHGKNVQSDKTTSMMSANMEHARNTHFGGINSLHQMHHMAPHFDVSNSHTNNLHSRMHNNAMHGKSAALDNIGEQSFLMEMRDSTGKSMLENNDMKWKQLHDKARTYETGPSSGSGTLGVFPNANVGGCGIPLLLSCSPSVVSGSLAKSHPPTYTSPLYRAGDEFNFHNKRDTKQTDDTTNNKFKRTPKYMNTQTIKE